MHLCLFDIDGMLLHSAGAGSKALRAAVAEEFDAGDFRGRVLFSGRTDRAIVRDVFELFGVAVSEENWRRFVNSYLSHLRTTLEECPGTILPGVSALLNELSQRADVELGLLTGNVRDGAQLKLAHYKLADYFPFGGFGDEHVDRNLVARDAVTAARAHLGEEAVRDWAVYVFGDTPNDVRCGRAIGAKVVAVATGEFDATQLREEEPDLFLEDFSDPKPILSLLENHDRNSQS